MPCCSTHYQSNKTTIWSVISSNWNTTFHFYFWKKTFDKKKLGSAITCTCQMCTSASSSSKTTPGTRSNGWFTIDRNRIHLGGVSASQYTYKAPQHIRYHDATKLYIHILYCPCNDDAYTKEHPYRQTHFPVILEQCHLLMAHQRVITTAAAAPCAWCNKAWLLVARAAFSISFWVALHKMSSNISDNTSPCTNWLLLVRSSLTSGSSTLANNKQMPVNYNAGYRIGH